MRSFICESSLKHFLRASMEPVDVSVDVPVG